MTRCKTLTLFAAAALAWPAFAQGVPGETWQRYATPADAGFDAAKLAGVQAEWAKLPSSAFMIIRDGAVVAAWGDLDRRYMCHSTRKSLLSGLIGVYHDAGEIDLEQTMGELGISDIEDGLNEIEQQATIHDLLKARSGVYRLAAYEPPNNPKPPRGSHAPGTAWCYNNWDFNTLNTVFQQVTGDDTFEAFDQHLAQPLGMQDFRVSDGYYHLEAEKSEHPAYPFRMSARDMARFGVLFEREGDWGGERVLSAEWVRASRTSYSDYDESAPPGLSPGPGGYGYMWWVFSRDEFARDAGMYGALGVGNQLIAVLPEHDLVIVNRANTYDGERTPTGALLGLIQGTVEAIVGPVAADATLVPLADDGIEFVAPESGGLDLSNYVGTFSHPPAVLRAPFETTLATEIVGNALRAVTPTNGTFLWYPDQHGAFVSEDSQERVIPWRDAAGDVIGFADLEVLIGQYARATAAGDAERAGRLRAALDRHAPNDPNTVGVTAAIAAANGIDAGPELEAHLAARPESAQALEAAMNLAGYAYLQSDKAEASVRVFRVIAERFPESYNAWDSLGEGLMNAGEGDAAIEAYRRSLKLNPANGNAEAMIQQIQAGG